MTEIVETDETELIPNRKRKLSDEDKVAAKRKNKSEFNAKEFRNSLNSNIKTESLKEFLHLIETDASTPDCIQSYLESGGNIVEILQIMDRNLQISHILIFKLTNKILLKIQAKYQKYQTVANEASLYLLKTYISSLNTMLSTKSQSKDRLAALQLLTTLVTFSAALAKDILQNISFHPVNLTLLTTVKDGKTQVRNAFVYFVVAFLVDGHFPTILLLLEKKGLLTSVIHGLKFDRVETVVLFITAIKSHVLENGSVSKTIKLQTFNTKVVRDILQLYNWRGPGGLGETKSPITNKVDEVDKSKVNEAVHAFLLVLCTSHKNGVIFRDPTFGLSNKGLNPLMQTVLDSLMQPWEHSYASELVIKICGACPDLTKIIWANIRSSLTPRPTNKWLNTIKFAGKLVEQFKPDLIAPFVNELNLNQIRQIVINLSSPPSIIKALFSEDQAKDNAAIKYHVLKLVRKMANVLVVFRKQAENWPNLNSRQLDSALESHILRSFPHFGVILNGWNQAPQLGEESEFGSVSNLKLLGVCFDLLHIYKNLAPDSLTSISLTYNCRDFLQEIELLNADKLEQRQLQVKAIKFFIELDKEMFDVNTELFANVIQLSLEFYYDTNDLLAFEVLHLLLKSSRFFDDFEDEIPLWIDGVLNLSHYDNDIALFLISLIRMVNVDPAKYYSNLKLNKCCLSLLLMALEDYFQLNEVQKSLKSYLNFILFGVLHYQSDLASFCDFLEKFKFVSVEFLSYSKNWAGLEGGPLKKLKGRITGQFCDFSETFLNGTIENELDYSLYTNYRSDLIRMGIFYFAQLAKAGYCSEQQYKNMSFLVDGLIKEELFNEPRYCKIILGNSLLLDNISLFDNADFSTSFIYKLITSLSGNLQINDYLTIYKAKIVSVLGKVFKKPNKYEQKTIALEFIEIIGLEYEQCVKIIERFLDNKENLRFYKVVVFCLERIASLAKANYALEPLNNEIVGQLATFYSVLAQEQPANLSTFSAAFLNYLQTFPHNIAAIEAELVTLLLKMPEYHRDNLKFCEFLLERNADLFPICFVPNLAEICAKKSFILSLLDLVIAQHGDDAVLLESIFKNIQPQIDKALQKPHKAGQHFHNHYKSIGILIEKFMPVPKNLGNGVQKFETSESFHAHLLKIVYDKQTEKSEKQTGNLVLTFIHLLNGILKQKSGSKHDGNVHEMSEIFFNLLTNLETRDLTFLNSNESLKLFTKLAIEAGIATSNGILLDILAKLFELCSVQLDDARDLLALLHSNPLALEQVLGGAKLEILGLWHVICAKHPALMAKSHVPVLLAAYTATNSAPDRANLRLLKMYETSGVQTEFFAFRPFLWGGAAAGHYAVRAKPLWRQACARDVLSGLQTGTVRLTVAEPEAAAAYDLDFFLPLFCHLLSSEQVVHVRSFARSGALALTLVALRSKARAQRLAACEVLNRFYFHLGAVTQGTKDKALWTRFVEAVAIGLAAHESAALNNFASVFVARSALVLAQPDHGMYVPLSQFLVAKNALNFETIPELYTFLHGSGVGSRVEKFFVLTLIRDGLREEKDVAILLNAMGFKLISELLSSCIADNEVGSLILDIFVACCRIEFGSRILCTRLSFMAQISNLVTIVMANKVVDDKVLFKLFEILRHVLNNEASRHRYFIAYINVLSVLQDHKFSELKDDVLDLYFEVFYAIVNRFPGFLLDEHFALLMDKCKNDYCKYLSRFGSKFVRCCDFVNRKALCCIVYKKING